MCGIAGIFDSQLNIDEGNHILEKMLQKIAHRGPDARGKFQHANFFLGHNRLSIIDLKSISNQPFHRGNLSIVFNGEIYNYIELKQELQKKGHAFVTDSDTEVILAAYQEYGITCVNRFVGMWAFAILDRETNELFCSRDRFGIKPFYYWESAQKFAFASEKKAFSVLPEINKEVNRKIVSTYLQLGMVDGVSDTFFEHIKSLPAAHNLHIKQGKIHISRYWDLTPAEHQSLSENEAIEAFSFLLKQSVNIHSRSDVAVGACLSGGLDSSSLCALMAAGTPEQRIKAFHIYYTGQHGVDERNFAQMVRDTYPQNIELHTFSPNPKELSDHFADFMQNMESPVPSSSPYSQYFVMQLAASHGVKVVIDGQGADEYMAGYKHAAYRFLYDEIKQNGIGAAMKQFKALDGIKSIGGKDKIQYGLKTLLTFLASEKKLYSTEYDYALPSLSLTEGKMDIREGNFPGRLQNFLYHQIFQTSLNSLLYYEDRNSMRFSIESRVPFLDHRLPEFVMQHAPNLILKDGWSKYILRKAIAPYLPEKVTYRRDKKGFVTPGEIIWLDGPLKEQLMAEPWIFPDQTVNSAKAEKLRKEYLRGNRPQANMVWRLATLSYWYKNVAPQL